MRMPSYEDPFAKLFQGDALEVLGELKPENVDLVVTSPPYYGLRSYPDTERVWGGAEGCEHSWQASALPPTKIGGRAPRQ